MKRKGLLIGTAAMSVGGLIIDRVILNGGGPGPASASAEELMALGEAALAANPSPDTNPGATQDHAAVRQLVERLGVSTPDASGTADAFALPDWLAPVSTQTPAPASTSRTLSRTLSAVMVGPRNSAAVVDGRVFHLGETHRGATLVSVEPDGAVLLVDGVEVRLALRR
ncbi:MAG: hypothetical protein AAGI53_08140 [Planctomycetota bacterium]